MVNEIVEKILNDLNCVIYNYNHYEKLIYIKEEYLNCEHLIIKSLIEITSILKDFNINYEIDCNLNIKLL